MNYELNSTSMASPERGQTLASKALVFAGRSLLVFGAVLCALGTVISGFSFTVSMSRLILVWLIGTIAAVAVTTLYRARGIFILAIPVFLIFMFTYAQTAEGFRWVVHSITADWSKWLPIPELFSQEWTDTFEPTAFFAVLGTVLILLLAATICLKHSTQLTVMLTLPFVLVSFILVDTQPGNLYLLGLIAVYLTLYISSALNYGDAKKAMLSFLPSIILSVFLIALAYLITPPGRYVRDDQMEAIRTYLNSLITQVRRVTTLMPENTDGTDNGWFDATDIGVWWFNLDKVDIADAGVRVIRDRNLLEIISSVPGTHYLRGYSMDIFDGRSWVTAERAGRWETLSEPWEGIMRSIPTALIRTYIENHHQLPNTTPAAPQLALMNTRKVEDITNIDYYPYYTASTESHIPYANSTTEVIIEGSNTSEIMDDNYTFSGAEIEYVNTFKYFYHVPSNVRIYAIDEVMRHVSSSIEGMFSYAQQEGNEDVFDKTISIYTAVDKETAEALRELAALAGIDPDAKRSVIVDAVSAYIRSTGTYTLSPPRTPEGEDFTLYFLQDSKQGYCIHYATAATLMLRSLDIPARFVTGYTAEVSQDNIGMPVFLTDRNAHAWVEVYYEDIGWVYLEVTPSAAGSGIPAARQHTRSDETPTEIPEPVPTETSVTDTAPPLEQDTSSEQQHPIPEFLLGTIITAAVAIALVIVLLTRRHILSSMRNKRFTQKNTNAAVISMWQYAVKISHRQAIPPTDIEELALKARFSLHHISEKERGFMLAYTRRLAKEIYGGKGDLARLWFRYIRGLG